MAILEINDLHFTFPQLSRETLPGISLSIDQGEFVVICGPSGCGKTTLLRHMKVELRPHGKREGTVRYRGKALEDIDSRVAVQRIGFVQQDPENQIVMEKVLQELAFGLENLNVPAASIRKRIAELSCYFGIDGWLHRSTASLSGGEKQLINLASVLLLRPEIVLLDEPTGQLDPLAAKHFLQLLKRLNEELSLTVVIAEHRLDDLFPIADRIVVLDKTGKIKYEGTPREVIREMYQNADELHFSYLPSLVKLFLSVRPSMEPPLTVREGRNRLAFLAEAGSLPSSSAAKTVVPNVLPPEPPVLSCCGLSFQYERHAPLVLRDLRLGVYSGDFLAVVGGNGAGKSTLLQLLAGLLPLRQGTVKLLGEDIRKLKDRQLYSQIGYLPQHPLSFFLYDTIGEELRQAALRYGLADAEEKLQAITERFALQPLLAAHPHDLSGGERQKAALACIVLSGPKVLLLDEPTKGIDPVAKGEWGELLRSLAKQGAAVVCVTHDVEFAAQYANRCAMLFDGQIAAEGRPPELFGDNYFYTTAINRLIRDYIPDALTYKEVVEKWPDPALRF